MPAYDQQSIHDLAEMTLYESWLLEAAYAISEESLFPEWPDKMIYLPDGSAPSRKAMGFAVLTIGDWRPEFLKVGAPLIFMTTFKLLDMVVEWILKQNGRPSTFRFAEKIRHLNTGLNFPPYMSSRTWLQQRLIALYQQLEPLRGTIIHDRHFETMNGALDVSSSRGNNVGPTVSLSAKVIRSLAVVIVSVLRYLDGTWLPDPYREKVLRRALDDLTHLHGLPSLNQKSPYSLTVRAYVLRKDSITVDVERIHRDVCTELPAYDVVFDVRLIAIEPVVTLAASYLLPWEFLSDKRIGCIVLSFQELAKYETALPNDFDAAKVVAELLASENPRLVAG